MVDHLTASTIDRIDYSNDTPVSTRGPLTLQDKEERFTLQNKWVFQMEPLSLPPANSPQQQYPPNYFGYFTGGYNGVTFGMVSAVDRISFANDTPTSVRGPMDVQKRYIEGTGSTSYGYVVVVQFLVLVYSSTSRLDYSNDTATMASKGPLSAAQYKTGAGNNSYGWIIGGLNSSYGCCINSKSY